MEQLENALADARFDLQKVQSHCDQLEVQLADAVEELHTRPSLPSPIDSGGDKPGPSSAAEVKGEKAVEQTTPNEEVRIWKLLICNPRILLWVWLGQSCGCG